MIKTVIFFIVLIMLSCTKESINPEMDSDVKDSNDSEQEVLVESDEIPDITEVDDETFEVDDEIFEVDDETFEVDDETFEVDDEAFEVDDEAFEVDDETFDVDDDADIVEVPLDGFGLISGACGVLDDELVSSDSFIFLNKIDFKNDPYDEADYLYLSTGGKKIYDEIGRAHV